MNTMGNISSPNVKQAGNPIQPTFATPIRSADEEIIDVMGIDMVFEDLVKAE